MHSTQQIRFVLPDFEGPLDLLLHLIEAAKVEITRIAVLDITDQFLAIVRSAPEHDLEQASAFVVMAATLLMIKSRSLLPQYASEDAPHEDHEEDVEAIVVQLNEYKRVRALAAAIAARDGIAQQQYARERWVVFHQDIGDVQPLVGLTLEKLKDVARTVAQRAIRARPSITDDRVTIQQRIVYVRTQLQQCGGEAWWSQLIAATPSRMTIVVTWMALLELVHDGTCACVQLRPFADVRFFVRGQGG